MIKHLLALALAAICVTGFSEEDLTRSRNLSATQPVNGYLLGTDGRWNCWRPTTVWFAELYAATNDLNTRVIGVETGKLSLTGGTMSGSLTIDKNLNVIGTQTVVNLYVTNIYVMNVTTSLTVTGSGLINSNLEVKGEIVGPTITALQNATNNLSGRVAGIEGNTSKWETAYTDSASATGAIAIIQNSTSLWNKAATDGVSATSAVAVIQSSTSLWNQASADGITATSAIPRITTLEGSTSLWNTAATDASTSTGAITVIQSSTSLWSQAATDASGATNDIVGLKASTNALNTRLGITETNAIANSRLDANLQRFAVNDANGATNIPYSAITNPPTLGSMAAANTNEFIRTNEVDVSIQSYSANTAARAGSAGKSSTNTWVSGPVDAVTNVQIFLKGLLTSWTTNGVQIP